MKTTKSAKPTPTPLDPAQELLKRQRQRANRVLLKRRRKKSHQ